MLHTFLQPVVLTRTPQAVNSERLYSLSMADDDTRTLLYRLVSGFLIYELWGTPLVCPKCIDLALIDSLVPEDAGNVVLTMAQYRHLSAFVGLLAISQARQPGPILANYTRAQIRQSLSRFFFLPLTRLRPVF